MVYPRLILGHAGLNATLQIVGKGNGLCIECQDREVELDFLHVRNIMIVEPYGRKWKEITQFMITLKERG